MSVGTKDDPGTARFGETYQAFFRRTVPASFKNAWRLETKRLGDIDMGIFDRRMLRHRLLHGIAAEVAIAVAILVIFGPASLFIFLLQAYSAIRQFEAVNYFQHWGLERQSKSLQTVDSWETHSWFTYYAFAGLSAHPDHHAWPGRPYQQLRTHEESPVLPGGYLSVSDMATRENSKFIERATAELQRLQLGPFTVGTEPHERELKPTPSPSAEHVQTNTSVGAPARLWKAVPSGVRLLLGGAAFLAAVSLGTALSSGVRYQHAIITNLVILVSFVLMLQFQNRLQRKFHGGLAMGVAILLLAALGELTHIMLR